MRMRRGPGIEVKSPAQLSAMRDAGRAVADALRAAGAAAVPGASTADLDAIAAREIIRAGAVPSFPGYHGYPATICTSVNDEIVHGVPDPHRRLRDGDVVSIDIGAAAAGWHADAAVTVGVGTIPARLARLLGACQQALWHGLSATWPGGRLSDIGSAVERSVRAAGEYAIVDGYGGHGIGSRPHMAPPVPSRGRPGRGPVLAEGMALAVEPLLVLGAPGTRLRSDGWTVVTADGGVCAHFGHTVAVTATGPWVLTANDGGVDGFARLAAGLPGPARPPGPGRWPGPVRRWGGAPPPGTRVGAGPGVPPPDRPDGCPPATGAGCDRSGGCP